MLLSPVIKLTRKQVRYCETQRPSVTSGNRTARSPVRLIRPKRFETVLEIFGLRLGEVLKFFLGD